MTNERHSGMVRCGPTRTKSDPLFRLQSPACARTASWSLMNPLAEQRIASACHQQPKSSPGPETMRSTGFDKTLPTH